MKIELLKTGDGSPTLFLPEQNEHYHSYHGAINESRHIFVNAGLDYYLRQFTSSKAGISKILEVGMGTGLNVFLAYLYSIQNPQFNIRYTSLEPYPIEQSWIEQLNYPMLLKADLQSGIFSLIHSCDFNSVTKFGENFYFIKKKDKIQDFQPDSNFDIIFFDAFSPRIQPELWTKEVFLKIYNAMSSGGILVTYCAKGEVKRILKSIGFVVESLPGPPGKREMVRASRSI
jgi:tRNA U34 5-methylaminomethyl-2-thiouridine-forming methyltransferase MnmC